MNNKLPGLDLLRALAVTLVFLSHYEFITGYNPFGMMSQFGSIGVDLFFVLSGYLIGNQIFYPFTVQKSLRLKDFYFRRALRIFPTYYFMLMIYFLAPIPIEQPLEIPLWRFITFTMNLNAQVAGAFSNAWSLCVEEHFYLIFPLVAIMMLKKLKPRYFIALLSLSLMGTIMLRHSLFIHFVQNTPNYNANYLRYIYFPTFCRLDSLIFGVAAAMCKNFHISLWDKLTQYKWAIHYFILGCLGLLLTRCLFQAESLKVWSTTGGYTLAGFSSLLLLLAVVHPQSIFNRRQFSAISLLAAAAYSIYLTQKISIYFVFQFFAQHLNAEKSNVCVISVTLATLLFGWMVYRCVERPFLKLRHSTVNISHEGEPSEQVAKAIL